MYNILPSDDVVYCDVDETLVFWNTDVDPLDKKISVRDPYIEDTWVRLVPHDRNIDLLKRMHGQGKKIIVWSLGGVFWARNVVDALKLQEFVHMIIVKPRVYIDDTDIEEWGCSRVYLSKYLSPVHGTKYDKKL